MKEYETLMIEVTRNCNFSCGHCLRGDAQNKDFDVKYLRDFLKKTNQKYFSNITLTGGEPFLKISILNKIIDVLKESNVEIGNYYIATNGSIWNKRVFEFISRLHFYCDDNEISQIEISNSKWHQAERIRLGLNQYVYQDIDSLIEEKYNSMKDIYFDFSQVNLTKDHRLYKNMIAEGRINYGSTPQKQDSLVYLNAVGEVIFNYCDLSYKTQTKKKNRSLSLKKKEVLKSLDFS